MRDSPVADGEADAVRLDVWLDVACLFRTRSEAQKACRGGKIDVNEQPARPNRLLHVGDRIEISRPFGRKQEVKVRKLLDKHVARAEARLMYEDLTPAPTPEEIEQRRLERIYRAQMSMAGTPGSRDRRELRRLKGKS